LQASNFVPVGCDNLDPDGKSVATESRWGGERGAARHRDEQGCFHPFVVSLHPHAGDAARPVLLHFEG
jgi:hypothetical protein